MTAPQERTVAEALHPIASPRTPLTRDRVLDEAIALADEGGIAALTMRRLAQRLGVEAMSLYHYVSGKDQLVEGMTDKVVSEMTVAHPSGDWKAELRRSAISAKDVLSRHPWATQAQASSAHPLPARFRFMEGLLATLRGAGFSPAATDHAYHALDSHITGFTLWIASMRLDEVDLEAVARTMLRDLQLAVAAPAKGKTPKKRRS
jgi:AcrR family transcriptional regulator